MIWTFYVPLLLRGLDQPFHLIETVPPHETNLLRRHHASEHTSTENSADGVRYFGAGTL